MTKKQEGQHSTFAPQRCIRTTDGAYWPSGRHWRAIYVRASTKEQAERDGDPEGYSISAQREACERKAFARGGRARRVRRPWRIG